MDLQSQMFRICSAAESTLSVRCPQLRRQRMISGILQRPFLGSDDRGWSTPVPGISAGPLTAASQHTDQSYYSFDQSRCRGEICSIGKCHLGLRGGDLGYRQIEIRPGDDPQLRVCTELVRWQVAPMND